MVHTMQVLAGSWLPGIMSSIRAGTRVHRAMQDQFSTVHTLQTNRSWHSSTQAVFWQALQ